MPSTGYIRQDTNDDISDGSVIEAAPLDAEFNALETAFDDTDGHTHDGTSGEGGPIVYVGPSQNIEVTVGAVLPDTDDTYDLGSSSRKFKDVYIDGTGYFDAIDLGGNTPLVDANNLSDLDSASTARTNLGLGTAALVNTGTGSGDVPTTSQADSRYAQLSGATFTGAITSSGRLKTTAANNGTNPPIALIDGDTGERGFSGIGSKDILVVVNGTSGARFEEAGSTVSNSNTVITREKGDARYAQLSGTTFAGDVTFEGDIERSSGSIIFKIGGITRGIIQDTTTLTISDQDIITRQKGDARYASISSLEYKYDLKPSPYFDIRQVNTYEFTYKKDAPTRAGEKSRGVILEQLVEAGLPEVDKGNGQIDYGPLIAVLIEEVKTLKDKVLDLELQLYGS